MSIIDKISCMVDLHLHLDGAISVSSARKLAELAHIDIPETDEELLELLRVSEDCRDLNEFLEKFAFPCSLLQTAAGIKMAVVNLLEELKTQGVMYAEIRFAPQKSVDNGMSQAHAVQAALDGIAAVDGIEAQLILCCMRGADNYAANLETVAAAVRYMGWGVCALDLAGAEGLFPTVDFSLIFEKARDFDIPFTIHAGEADGPASIDAALDFGAARIGHGVRCLENAETVKRLVDNHIPLELCPSSNLNTAIYKDISEFPLRELMDAGITVTINTDDPSIEGTDIKREFKMVQESARLSDEELKQLLINAVNASFAQEDLKKSLVRQVEEQFA